MYIPRYGNLDFSRSSKEIVLDLIYLSNRVTLYPNRTSLGTPTELDTRPGVAWDENTIIAAKTDNNADPSDDVTGTYPYHRLSFSEAGLRRLPESFAGLTVWEILPAINEAYHLNLTEADIANDQIPVSGLIVLKASKGSFVWQGKSNINVGDFLLNTVELDCFKEYAA